MKAWRSRKLVDQSLNPPLPHLIVVRYRAGCNLCGSPHFAPTQEKGKDGRCTPSALVSPIADLLKVFHQIQFLLCALSLQFPCSVAICAVSSSTSSTGTEPPLPPAEIKNRNTIMDKGRSLSDSSENLPCTSLHSSPPSLTCSMT